MKRYNIENKNIEFKNLISGPAPIGRILNYIKLAGQNKLKHKNGHRATNLIDNIGYAWTTEFMIGLGLVQIGAEINDKVSLLTLTTDGRLMYDRIINHPEFNEGVRNNDIYHLRNYILTRDKELYDIFESIFRKSYPFIILREYLNENKFYYSNRKEFMDDYFEAVKNKYDVNSTPYNRNARTTTGENRVPSVLQLCYFFEYITDIKDLDFDEDKINREDKKDTIYTANELKEVAEKEDEIHKIIYEKIIEQYGLDGTYTHSIVSRCSRLQQMFKHNLMVEQSGKCVICGMENKELLIGSHIKSASESNSIEKANSNNGLLLCANHDKLFDRHLISFDFLTGEIWISKSLVSEDIKRLGLDYDISLPQSLMNDERSQFLLSHNITFQNKEKNR